MLLITLYGNEHKMTTNCLFSKK